MKKITAFCFAFALSMSLIPAAFGASPPVTPPSSLPGFNEVTELGHINGAALFCRQSELMAKIKNGLDATLPKPPAYELYDEVFVAAIKESFLKQQQNNLPCAAPKDIDAKIDTLLNQLKQALKK